MALFTKNKTSMPEPGKALPGRPNPIPTATSHFVNGAPLKGPYPDGSEIAMFGLGCFWGAEKGFWSLPGVLVSAVGYAGGFTPNPTYEEICSGQTGHAEVVRVVFDPKRIGYSELLRAFWEGHDPTQHMRQGADVGTQYRSAIYTYSERQAQEARASKAGISGRTQRTWLRRNRYGDRARRRVLFRGRLPPAISGEEPARLLRPRRHRRELPRWAGHGARGIVRRALRGARATWAGGLLNRQTFGAVGRARLLDRYRDLPGSQCGIVRDMVAVANNELQRVLARRQRQLRFRLPLAEVLHVLVHRQRRFGLLALWQIRIDQDVVMPGRRLVRSSGRDFYAFHTHRHLDRAADGGAILRRDEEHLRILRPMRLGSFGARHGRHKQAKGSTGDKSLVRPAGSPAPHAAGTEWTSCGSGVLANYCF